METDGLKVGRVTSGNFSPVLGRGIALALVETSAKVSDGDQVAIAAQGGELTARVTKPPFVKNGRPAVELTAL